MNTKNQCKGLYQKVNSENKPTEEEILKENKKLKKERKMNKNWIKV